MKKISLLTCLLFATHLFYAQQSITASGGEATGVGGSSSYSVGQLVYNTNYGNGSITQGIQQSIELITLNNSELNTIELKAILYPNPTSDFIVLVLTDINLKNLSYTLYDIQARIVVKGLVSDSNTHIWMQDLEIGSYILKVDQSNIELKTFKIIKN